VGYVKGADVNPEKEGGLASFKGEAEEGRKS